MESCSASYPPRPFAAKSASGQGQQCVRLAYVVMELTIMVQSPSDRIEEDAMEDLTTGVASIRVPKRLSPSTATAIGRTIPARLPSIFAHRIVADRADSVSPRMTQGEAKLDVNKTLFTWPKILQRCVETLHHRFVRDAS